MAKLLVAAIDSAHTDPAARYLQGDIIVRYPDSYQFQAAEGLPKFWQFTTVDLLDTDNTQLLASVRDAAQRLVRRRQWFIDVTQLSALARAQLARDGSATVLRIGLLAALAQRT